MFQFKSKSSDFTRNKTFLNGATVSTSTEKYKTLLHKAIGIDNGIQNVLKNISDCSDEKQIIEDLRTIVEYFDLKEFTKSNF